MTNVSDEVLMAYADGELSREDCRRLEAMLTQDAGLRARLEPFAMIGSSLADVFDRPLREPIPDRLLAVITAGGRSAPAARNGAARPAERQKTGVFDAIAEALFPRGLGFAGAFTFTALFAAGGAAGYLVSHMGTPSADGTTVVAAGDLRHALESQPSIDSETAIRSGAALWPAQSFKSQDQGFCREYKIAGKGGSGFAGVACRGADAEWRVAVHAEVKTGSAADFKLLGEAESPAVEAAVEKLKQGDVFGPDEELAAIARGWSTNNK